MLDFTVKPLAATEEELARERARDLEGAIDVHTHLWPEGFYRAIVRWFDDHAWRVAFRGSAEEAIEALRREGTSANVALAYAHKPGVARVLNRFLGEITRAHPSVIGVGAVMPGETDARAIVREAAREGLRGVKIHCHVIGIAIDDPRTMEVLRACEELGLPAVVHAGRAPRSPAYPADTHAICGVTRTERVLRALPKLKLVIPHLGLDEIDEHFALLERYENLWLDTAMACAEYFPHAIDWERVERFSDRVLFGTDWPILPYEPDREKRVLARRVRSDEAFERILRGNAKRLWLIP